MLDVLHYFFEVDLHETPTAELIVKTERRQSVYSELYGRDYAQGRQLLAEVAALKERQELTTTLGGIVVPDDDEDPLGGVVPFDPKTGLPHTTRPKPMIPRTKVNADSPLPFGPGIEPPLN